MYYYKTTIQYEGSNYAGFQWQKGIQTIQSEFNKALATIVDGKFTTMAASRTDTGVHAKEQIVKISCVQQLDLAFFFEALNFALPGDIRCINVEACEGLFRPAAQALSKEYRYFFTNKTQVAKADQNFIANISNPLNIQAMMICIHALVGSHDFCNFFSRGSNVSSTIRNVLICELAEIAPQDIFTNSVLFKIPNDLASCYQIRIVANGFLKQMIRHIVSALWMVGSGKISSADFLSLLDGPKIEKHKWKVASPNGLFLYRINYSN